MFKTNFAGVCVCVWGGVANYGSKTMDSHEPADDKFTFTPPCRSEKTPAICQLYAFFWYDS